MRRVVVTGMGIISSIGNSLDEVTESLRNARPGIVAAPDYAEGSATALKARLEKLMADRFGFAVGVVLRSEDEIRAMLAGHPFASLDPKADVTRHVLMFDQALPAGLQVEDRPGHTEILRIDPRDVYIAGYRQPNGRYTEGVEDVLKPLYGRLDKPVLDTMRNWNPVAPRPPRPPWEWPAGRPAWAGD